MRLWAHLQLVILDDLQAPLQSLHAVFVRQIIDEGNFQDDFQHLECPLYQGVRECGGALLPYQASDEAEWLHLFVFQWYGADLKRS